MGTSAQCGMRNAEGKIRHVDTSRITRHSALVTPNSKGFTLLEVMVAVSIMSLVLVTLLGLKNRTMQDVMLAEHMTTATLLAKRMMTAEILKGRPTLPLEDEGEFSEEEFKGFTWRKTIFPLPLFQMMEVRVAVLWKEGTRQEMVELVDYE